MNISNQYITASPDGSNTVDIIYSLSLAVPAAINQYIDNPIFEEIIDPVGNNPLIDGVNICRFIQANVTYKADNFTEQNIKLPAQLIKTGIGDCKSFSLFFLSAAFTAGYETGLRFASYSKNKKFTHVYNFIKFQNKIYTFDACVKNLKESNKYTNIKDMKVTYLAGTPTMITGMNEAIEIANNAAIGKRTKEQRKQKRAEKKEKRKSGGGFIKRALKAGKKVALAGPRGSFILLVDVNFRGLARKLKLAREKSPEQYKELWLKLGGDPSKLDKAVAKGINKKPFLGTKKGINGPYTENDYIGAVAAATITTAVVSAAALLAAFQKLFKSLNIKSNKDEGTEDEMEDLIKDENGDFPVISEDGNFNTIDSDGEEAERYNKKGEFQPMLPQLNGGSNTGGKIIDFIKSPIGLIALAGGGYAVYKAFSGKSNSRK